MDIFEELKSIITDLLDIEDVEITPGTYMVKDLNAESIDLLELAVAINSRFNITVVDDDIFLNRFRQFMFDSTQKGEDPIHRLTLQYPFLTGERIREIATKLKEGPQLKVADLISYVKYQQEEGANDRA